MKKLAALFSLAAIHCTEESHHGGGGTAGGAGAAGEGGVHSTSSQSSNGGSTAMSASTSAAMTSSSSGTTLGETVDLRDYFPAASATRSYRRSGGSAYSRYTFFPATADFNTLYTAFLEPTPPHAGSIWVWQKAYYSAMNQPPSAPCVATYALLHLGDDQQITEAGDYLSASGSCSPSIPFGYQKAGTASGLRWSTPGGFTVGVPAREVEIQIAQRATASDPYAVLPGYFAYSHVEFVERLASFTPDYGSRGSGVFRSGGGKTYDDVVRIVFHHGVRTPNQTEFRRCTPPSPADEYTVLYRSEPNYDSYASEYYFARGYGMVQEGFVYNEHNAYFDAAAGTSQDCRGMALDADRANVEKYQSYVDEP